MNIIPDRTAALASVHQKIFGHLAAPKNSAPARSTAPVTADDAAVIDAVLTDLKYARLWNGDASGYTSASEADLAIVGRIAFFAGHDPARIDRIFRQSGLCRGKWIDRADYRERTISRAVSGMTRFYNWSRRPLAERGRA